MPVLGLFFDQFRCTKSSGSHRPIGCIYTERQAPIDQLVVAVLKRQAIEDQLGVAVLKRQAIGDQLGYQY